MSENNFLKIDLVGKLTKPLTRLVERCSDLAEIVIQPSTTRRLAIAQADGMIAIAKAKAESTVIMAQGKSMAAAIAAESKVEVAAIQVHGKREVAVIEADALPNLTDVERRAARRLRKEEVRYQENLDAVASAALPMMRTDIDPEAVPDDWLLHFFDHARKVSDDEARQLWAKVLAGEVNAPGSFAKRTLNLLAEMSSRDAALFRTLCGTVCNCDGRPSPFVFRPEQCNGFYKNIGLDPETLWHLESTGLIHYSGQGYTLTFDGPRPYTVSYFGTLYELVEQSENYVHMVGCVTLSEVGRQLLPVVDPKPIDGHMQHVAENLVLRPAPGVGSCPDTPH